MKKKASLQLKHIGIDTYKEAVIYMAKDCDICISEGFEVHARILVSLHGHEILATLNTIAGDLLGPNEASLSNYAWCTLGAKEGDFITLSHPFPLKSLSYVRSKIYGHSLSQRQINAIVSDISKGFYSDIHNATFLTACAGGRLSIEEITHLTTSMVNAGEKLTWPNEKIVDKHSIGGLPGNRTTPIIVPIICSLGLPMPKTSSRAITSPAGTADVMEVLAPVNLSLAHMRKVVAQEGGCIIWGGSVSLSPADDILIRVERVVDLDSEGQLVASVLSKKISAGSSHVVIDIPVGPSAKVRNSEDAHTLKATFEHVAQKLGLCVDIVFSEGIAPVGYGIGPALEAQDVLDVLQNKPNAPQDLVERALALAARVLELADFCPKGEGLKIAKEQLQNGKAWEKFQHICEAQGGIREIPTSKHTHTIMSKHQGTVTQFDNRNLARIAKLAGAPHDKAAGIFLHTSMHATVQMGQPLYTIHSESKGELNYAIETLEHMPEIIEIKEPA